MSRKDKVITKLCDLDISIARISMSRYNNHMQIFQSASEGVPAQSVYISLQTTEERELVREFAHELLDACADIDERQKEAEEALDEALED